MAKKGTPLGERKATPLYYLFFLFFITRMVGIHAVTGCQGAGYAKIILWKLVYLI